MQNLSSNIVNMQKIPFNADMNTMHDQPLAMRAQQSHIPSDRWTQQKAGLPSIPGFSLLSLPAAVN